MTAMAVIVVPMPRWEGLAIAARKMSVFARAIERTNSVAVGRVATGSSESPLAAIAARRSRMPSTAIWLATSPASWPPIPSATTNAVSVTRRLSSFSGRTRPLSVADPIRSSAIARHSGPSLRLDHGRADLQAVALDGAASRRSVSRRCGTCRWSIRGPRPSAARRSRRRAGGSARRRRRRRPRSCRRGHGRV